MLFYLQKWIYGLFLWQMAKDNTKKFREELLGAVDNRNKGDIADVIGMPDEKDLETLTRIIRHYEKTHPGVLAHTVKTARDEFRAGTYGNRLAFEGDAVVSKQMNAVYAFELPADLGHAIEQVFPSMFKSTKHLRWFRKNFPQLTISGKKIK